MTMMVSGHMFYISLDHAPSLTFPCFLFLSIDDGEASENIYLQNYINEYTNAYATSPDDDDDEDQDDDDEEEEEELGTSARELFSSFFVCLTAVCKSSH